MLAGGAARRFGADKTRALLAGRAVLEHALDAVSAVADDVVVVGPWAPPGWAHHDEPTPRQGPAAAVAFGMGLVSAELVLVVGGDHPIVVPALLELLVSRAATGSADAVVAVRAGRDEPLVACYRRSIGGVAARLVASGRRSMRAVLDEVEVDRVPGSVWSTADPEGRSFMDVDTPEDLARVRALLDG